MSERLSQFDQSIKHHLLAAGVREVSFRKHPVNCTVEDVHVIPLTFFWSIFYERPRETIAMVMVGLDDLLSDIVEGYTDRGRLFVAHDHNDGCSHVYVAKHTPLDLLVGKMVTINAGQYKGVGGVVRKTQDRDLYMVECFNTGPHVVIRKPSDVSFYPPRPPHEHPHVLHDPRAEPLARSAQAGDRRPRHPRPARRGG